VILFIPKLVNQSEKERGHTQQTDWLEKKSAWFLFWGKGGRVLAPGKKGFSRSGCRKGRPRVNQERSEKEVLVPAKSL